MRSLIIVSLFIIWTIFTVQAQDQLAINQSNFYYTERETEKTATYPEKLDTDQSWEKHLIINSDSRVDTLIQIHREENIRKGGIDGYRVQIFKGTKDAAYQVEAKFKSIYENVFADTFFPSPHFVVNVGAFRTKSEAIKLQYLIKNEFPVAHTYIVNDVIKLSELGEIGDGN